MTNPTDGAPQGPADKPRKKRRRIDWTPIRADYEFGGLSLRELSERHEITESQLCVKAKADGWRRDVRAKAKASTGQVLAEEIYKELGLPPVHDVSNTPRAANLEAETKRAVDTIVEVNKVVLMRHHKRFSRAGEVAEAMLEELAGQAALKEHTELLARILAGEEPNAMELSNARLAVGRAVTLMTRSSILNKIVDSLTKLAEAERRALGLDEPEAAKPNELPPFAQIPPEKRMDAIMGMLRG